MSVYDVLWLCVVVFLAVGWYLSYTAARLHRLHSRVEGAFAVLDAQLVRRAEAALEWANAGGCDPASALLLADGASESLRAADVSLAEREVVESAMTARLRDVGAALPRMPWDVRIAPALDAMDERVGLAASTTPIIIPESDADDPGLLVVHAHERVRLARRFYNDAVADAIRLRQQPLVRWLHLAGHTRLPRPCEFDDDLTTT